MNIRLMSALRRSMGVALLSCVALLAAACTSTPIDPTWAGLSVVGDAQNILISFENRITLVDPTTGRPIELVDANNQVRVDDQGNPRLWDISAPDNNASKFYTAPLPLDDTWMLVTAYTKKIFRINIQDGQIVNPTTSLEVSGHVIATPVINGDMIYIGFSERNLSAYSLEGINSTPPSGTPLWTLETDHGIWASPLLVDNVLYIPCMNHSLYAVNAETGEVLWTADLQGAVTATPVYADGRLFVGSLARKVFEISAADGQILSEYTTQDWVWGAPAVVDNSVYVADMAGYVYALDITENGLTQRWMERVATMGIRATPVVFNDNVIVASRDTYVYWLNAANGTAVLDSDGNAVKRQVAGEVLANMLVVTPNDVLDIPQPLLIVSTMNHTELLVAFTLDTGQRRWVYGR